MVWQEKSDNTGDVDTVYRRFTDMDAAINALEKERTFTGWVSGVLNDRGNAEYLVIKDPEVHNINDDSGEGNSNGRLELSNLGIVPATTTGGSVTPGEVSITVENLWNQSIAGASEVEIRITSEDGTRFFNTTAKVNAANQTYTGHGIDQAGGVNDTCDLAFVYRGTQAASGKYTVTVTIEDASGNVWTATETLHLA